MQSRTSGASSSVPAPVIAAPEAPRTVPKSPRRWPWLLILIAIVAGGWYAWQKNAASERTAGKAATAAVPTAAVRGGRLERTVRLTGSTTAERFVSLIAPQMRGSRSGRGGDRFSRTSSGGSISAPRIQSGGGARGSVGSVGGAGGPGGISFSRSNASVSRRLGGTTSTSRSSSGTGTGGTGSMGSSGLGSTEGSLGAGMGGSSGGGSGGGGGRGGDFNLVLQELIKPGAHVKKGDIVAEFDRQYMLQRLDDYRASVEAAKLDLERLEARLNVDLENHEQEVRKARVEVEKAKLDLKTVPVRSAIESERFRLNLEEAEATLKRLLADRKYLDVSHASQKLLELVDYQQTQLELKRAEANVDRMVAKAAIPGLTVMQNTFRGTEFGQIQQGDQIHPGQLYMQIVDTSSMVINATVNQIDVDNLRIGAKARVRFDAYPDLELPAHVFSIGAMTKPGGMRASFVKEVPVKLKLDQMDPRVIPDLSVSADVIVEGVEAAAIAPLESVFHDGPDSTPYVFVRSGNEWLRREIELGLSTHTRAVITKGLRAGEVVALSRPEAPPKKA